MMSTDILQNVPTPQSIIIQYSVMFRAVAFLWHSERAIHCSHHPMMA